MIESGFGEGGFGQGETREPSWKEKQVARTERMIKRVVDRFTKDFDNIMTGGCGIEDYGFDPLYIEYFEAHRQSRISEVRQEAATARENGEMNNLRHDYPRVDNAKPGLILWVSATGYEELEFPKEACTKLTEFGDDGTATHVAMYFPGATYEEENGRIMVYTEPANVVHEKPGGLVMLGVENALQVQGVNGEKWINPDPNSALIGEMGQPDFIADL
jgi:sorbitol-specific phosphotransferase system component IIA